MSMKGIPRGVTHDSPVGQSESDWQLPHAGTPLLPAPLVPTVPIAVEPVAVEFVAVDAVSVEVVTPPLPALWVPVEGPELPVLDRPAVEALPDAPVVRAPLLPLLDAPPASGRTSEGSSGPVRPQATSRREREMQLAR